MTVVVVIVAIAAVVGGVAYVLAGNRQQGNIESGIDSFRREMDALAPPERFRRRQQGQNPRDPSRRSRGEPDAGGEG